MNIRQYTMTKRAAAAQETGERILAAAFTRFSNAYFEDVTLDQVAADAGVTVQTVLRRFGSKEGLVEALLQSVGARVAAQRGEAPAGDLEAAVANLVEHYEAMGDLAMLLVRQEERVGAYAAGTVMGKQLHADWVAAVFAPWLDARAGSEREVLLAQLITVCDVYTWYLLRRQRGLSRRQTELALIQILQGVLR